MKIRRIRSIMVVFVLMLLSGLFKSVAIADMVTFECEYSTYSDPKGMHKAEEPFHLTFLIDSKAKEAYSIGNNGSSKVMVVPNSHGFTFVEVTRAGNVMVTAIGSMGKSVHSRNGIVMGDIIPSQYYGACAQK